MFVIQNIVQPSYRSRFINLNSAPQSADKNQVFLSDDLRDVYEVEPTKLLAIPSSPIAYWVSEGAIDAFDQATSIGSSFEVRSGLTTGDNDKFLHYWHEVTNKYIVQGVSQRSEYYSLHNKGGDFRKWYGNAESVLKYGSTNTKKMKELPGFRGDGIQYFFREMIGWSKITSSKSSFRYYPRGFSFNTAGLAIFEANSETEIDKSLLFFLNSFSESSSKI